MDFMQTIGGQALASVLKESLPRLVGAVDRLAAAVERHNELTEQGQATEHYDMPEYVVPPAFAAKGEIPGEREARKAAEGQHG